MRLSVLRASGLLGGCPADLGTSPASSTALGSLSSVALSSGYRPLSYARTPPKTSLALNALNSLLTKKLLNAYQPYGPDDDARLFATAQFRRYRELADAYLPKLANIKAIRARLKGRQ